MSVGVRPQKPGKWAAAVLESFGTCLQFKSVSAVSEQLFSEWCKTVSAQHAAIKHKARTDVGEEAIHQSA